MAPLMNQFVSGLKSRNDETRVRAARDLNHYVTTELREVSLDDLTTFMDGFNHHIFEMVSSSDPHEKKGGILAIISLIGVDVGNTSTRLSRFANYLRNLLPTAGDPVVMEMAAGAMGRLALASGTYTSDYVEFEAKRAFEWLALENKSEGKRQAAVLVLRELAICTPTFFFQQIQQFFDCIFNAIRDPKIYIRESSVAALRAALVVTSQREIKEKEKPKWYEQCFEEVERPFDEVQAREKKMSRDDWAHGSLLITNELLRCSNIEGERIRLEMEEISQLQHEHDKSLHKEVQSSRFRYHLGPTLQQFQQKASLGSGSSPTPSTSTSQNAPSLSTTAVRGTQKQGFFESRTCKQLMTEKFNKICQLALRHRHSRNYAIQQTLLSVLPRLAAFQPGTFVKNYLEETLVYLLGSLRHDRERSAAFQAIGLLAVSVHDDINRHLPKIMEVIHAALPARDGSLKRKAQLVDPAVFTCISMLAKAVGPTIVVDIKNILDPMLSAGLSPALTAALHDLANQIPKLKPDIQDGLLRMLSVVLMRRELAHPGAPKLHQQSSHLIEASEVNSITLALKTLGSFDFEGHSLTPFVRYCAEVFLLSEYKDIRREAVVTCSRLLMPSIKVLRDKPGTVSSTAKNTVTEVLKALLEVGITDEDSDIRLCVLKSLDSSFDPHLAQSDNLAALFMALNDEVFEIREVALCTIGRLSAMNPAYVMPSLRKTLKQLLTELNCSGLGRNKEQAAIMLGHLVRSTSSRLIKPYMEPILGVLIPKLSEPGANPGVVVAVLAAIGEEAQVAGVDMRPWVDQLFPIILDMLQDSSSLQKRQVALWTLSQLIESTGCVVQPYRDYPVLLEILLNFLKTEQTVTIRREAIRVLGVLGALDPWQHKVHLGQIDNQREAGAVLSQSDPKNSNDQAQTEYTTSEMLVNMSIGATLNEFYPAAAIATLMKVIHDPSLFQHHTTVVQAITFIFKSLGLKCVPYLSQVMPAYIHVIRTADSTFREFLLQQLGLIISIVKQHIHDYLDDIFQLIKDYWTLNSSMQGTIILLVENIVGAIGTDFKVFLPQIIPQILKVFIHDTSDRRSVTLKLLNALQQFGPNLDEYLHLILPPIVKLFDASDLPIDVRKAALITVDNLSDVLDLTEYASRIVHPLIRVLDSCPELRSPGMNMLASLMYQMGPQFVIYVPAINKVLDKHRIAHQRYEIVLSRITQTDFMNEDDFYHQRDDLLPRKRDPMRSSTDHSAQTTIKKLHVSSDNLQKAWAASRRVSKDDWIEWLRRLSIELLKESPSPALRSCWGLAQNYNPLARDLFNAAFVSCWTELKETQQDELTKALEQALTNQDIPEITQTLLNLAEFMEHTDKGSLPISKTLLADRAMKRRAYAKALHYKEEDFQNGPNIQILESLISVNNKLQQPEAATGVLEYAKKHNSADLKVQERWYEKLHEWSKALHAYELKQEQQPDNMTYTLGRMRCLEALGEWGQLHKLAAEKWCLVDEERQQEMACMASAAAWGLKQWDNMEEYSCMIPRDTYDGAFYRAVLALHMDQYQLAQQCIDKARDILDTELTVMAGESYQRAYGSMVNVQMLAELEEVIQYKLVPDRRTAIKDMWWERLQGCQRVLEDWQRILQVHSLVVEPHEDRRTWLKYASLCRKNGRLSLSHKTLVMLLGYDPSKTTNKSLHECNPFVSVAYIKHMWKSNHKKESVTKLENFVDLSLQPCVKSKKIPEGWPSHPQLLQLLAKCHLKLGEWKEDIDTTSETSIPHILKHYHRATESSPKWYKAWHAFAFMNFEAVNFYKQQITKDTEQDSSKQQHMQAINSKIHQYCVSAVQGFVLSINLSTDSSLQDILRLLTLWFHHGHTREVNQALQEGVKTIAIDKWIQVIPQLIARIDTTRTLVGELVCALLTDIGKYHPQALIYPLTVASKSSVITRQEAANKILQAMREHSNTLVQQSMMMSDELIRVAILWHELWHEGLEEASRLYFGENNVQGMFATLEPLHAMMEQGPQTLKETSFNQAYGRDLMEARDWCRKYNRSGKVKDLTQAWDLYYHVFRRISKQLPQLTSLELQYVSPKLLMSRNLELAIPGTYEPNQPIIQIQRVQSSMNVITSKQRPRKLSQFGSNGKEYQFLLKGHEDLRQDERVMQLFGLVNSLLAKNPETLRRNLTIQRFSVIPLSTNSGLIGWVPHCDTLHSLIRDYRDKKKILLNIEHRIMLKMAPDYDHLLLLHKVEVFEHALDATSGDDLAKILWIKSPSSETWFDRRTNYTRSLAVMSMVGYVLGLGDRHPSNLMLDRMSGKVVHIDFGDCFEVAMTREKFPEKIPFRLTRMLINAMEVTGIDGNYRKTCQKVMDVLRDNKDSLMAVLEAFVYDPLLNWRLMEASSKDKRKKAYQEGVAPSERWGPKRTEDALFDVGSQPEAVTQKAIAIIHRVRDKLTGKDFQHVEEHMRLGASAASPVGGPPGAAGAGPPATLEGAAASSNGRATSDDIGTASGISVAKQVDLLIQQATAHENLCQCYIGWCPFW